MKTIIQNGTARYTVTCIYEKISSLPTCAARLTSAVLAKTGAELYVAAYDTEGALRHLWSAKGIRIALYRENGARYDLYGAEGNRLSHYDKTGTLCDLYDVNDRRSKVIATCRPDGTLATLADAKGKPLADLDENETVVAVRHPASDLLCEEDEEYAERLALAEARLPLAKQMQALERERRAFVDQLRETTLQNRAEGREIAVLPMGDVDVATLAARTLPLTGYAVAFEGETLTVRAYADLLLQQAFAALLETVGEGTDTWTLPADYTAAATDCRVQTEPPALVTEQGILRGVYYCGDENFERCYRGVTTEEYRAYTASLGAAGFEAYAENQIGDCLFGTYVTENDAVFTMHYPGLSRTQIVYGPRGVLPDDLAVPTPAEPITPVFIQPGRLLPYAGPTCAPGMSYVIPLADGSFIVIDGGPADREVYPKIKKKGEWIQQEARQSRDEEALYELLCQRTPEGKKPRIAVWFMSHPHGDHTALACSFLKNYEGKVDVETIAFNMPHFESCPCPYLPMGEKSCVVPFRERVTELYGAKTMVLHAGQRIRLPGCEVEVLYTQEDYYPASFASANHMSFAFFLKFEHRKIAILGDCEKQLCKAMADAYGNALKCDAVQVTHHGANGGDVDLYRYMDADICFWAVDDCRFETRGEMTGKADGYLYNRYLRDEKIKKRTHYPNDTTIILEV